MNKKTAKLLSLLLVSVLIFVFVGCSNDDSKETKDINNLQNDILTEEINADSNITSKQEITTAEVGNIITFGVYEQDNDTSNGKEAIEWLVLAKEGTKILVTSKYALDSKRFHIGLTDATWETCTLRKWLNNEFLSEAFSTDECAMIPTVTVSADENPEYSTNPGNVTEDKVFLLSITEANKYFESDEAKECEPTDYADAEGADSIHNGNCWWWLRSQYNSVWNERIIITCVDDGGVYTGCSVNNTGCAVRPAMWIDLSK